MICELVLAVTSIPNTSQEFILFGDQLIDYVVESAVAQSHEDALSHVLGPKVAAVYQGAADRAINRVKQLLAEVFHVECGYCRDVVFDKVYGGFLAEFVEVVLEDPCEVEEGRTWENAVVGQVPDRVLQVLIPQLALGHSDEVAHDVGDSLSNFFGELVGPLALGHENLVQNIGQGHISEQFFWNIFVLVYDEVEYLQRFVSELPVFALQHVEKRGSDLVDRDLTG
jgi:hypothetical protein